MSAQFCGNPFNHEPHTKNGMECEGINREEVKETIVEKFDPKVGDDTIAEDGTEYHKVTIIIEHTNGDTIIIEAPKSSYPRAASKVNPYIPLDKTTVEFYPEIESVDFSFKPHTTDEHPAVKITKVANNAVS